MLTESGGSGVSAVWSSFGLTLGVSGASSSFSGWEGFVEPKRPPLDVAGFGVLGSPKILPFEADVAKLNLDGAGVVVGVVEGIENMLLP